ncbi:heavy metal translocating P-type ATPase [Denitrovibrio acetiphilus DSM 12809]|uniref:P-type Zn(2+) transporter n=1 Tax=Denitrovibrio acetiphilus (strain DSM 12809 / NBRC 114555 / N2460) TaxID=522772 RepID=D4H2A2_DENA2|nr:heavy metal translocating P-type ATPase [Denitrovibrio acetiphilus]ADD68893.1 heavy metal translocating P-type ATPase [Denitrovibrio acetiphilus DSM 12809]
MTLNKYLTGLERVDIAHRTNGRIRFRAEVLGNPALDITLMESSLECLDGVKSVRINQKAQSLVVVHDPEADITEQLLNSLSTFTHAVFYADEELNDTPDLINVYWAGTMWVLKMGLPSWFKVPLTYAGAAPVLFSGVETLVRDGLRVEVLDAAVISLLLLRKDYFTAGSITFLLNLGHYLEASTEYKSDKMLRSLIKPDVEYVWVLQGQKEVKVSIDDVCVGSLVIIGAGEMISVDGVVYSGEGLINQSSVTGESLPVSVEKDSEVYAGTVVAEGKIIVAATKVGAETTSARIAKFITGSLKNRSTSEVRAFKTADKMVPVTFGIGLAALLLTRDFRRASSVLSVDYSCALKLVIPTAIKAGIFTAGSEGIFIKGAQALENFAEVDTIVFDKTGTLTKGSLEVSEIISYGSLSEEDLLCIAASAEEHYSHPIASAVVQEALKRGIALKETGEVDFIIAHGVSAYVEDSHVLAGSRHFVHEDEHIDCSHSDAESDELRKTGRSILYIAVNGELAGLIALKDVPREEACEVIRRLGEEGVKRVVMLTGDHKDTAMCIAGELGITEVYSEMKPEDKLSVVKELNSQGCKVAFVGDGVNDAPALLASHVGVSMPEGADLARETSDVILLRNNLHGILRARKISAETVKTIKQVSITNIGANSVTVFLSFLGLITPLQSALMHNGTTVGTLLYAMRSGGER